MKPLSALLLCLLLPLAALPQARTILEPKTELAFADERVRGAGRQTVCFVESPLPNVDFEHYPFKADGLVGNAPFDDAHVVIIDLPRRRMGVMPGGKSGGS